MKKYKICNGPFCKGKEWPETRFEKDKSCNLGRKTYCKMCVANRKNDHFVPGICMFCSKQHDCMFGSGQFCNRYCAMGKKTISRKKDLNLNTNLTKAIEINGKICTNVKCSEAGEIQPISNFDKRSKEETAYRSWCKKCCMSLVRKHQTTLDGFVKNSVNSARRRARTSNLEFELTADNLHKLLNKQDGKCAITGREMTHCSNSDGLKNPFNMSVDRIDSLKGYTIDNVQWICVWVQTAKLDWKEIDVKQWIIEAAKHIENINL